ncbi:hypothetical protein L7F22_038808 [Adiantum nelumboides]|nr:hypothetical protein [Adiantum nelumboides]
MPDADDVSHALLLRLFQSEFFSPHLALSYLKTYSDSIGITYYLVDQLRTAFDPSEVEFYWAQLCHLLISKPSKSRALEYFILQRCDESVHVALLTLWHFQAALFDMSINPHTESFQVCQRVFNQCQRLLYDDPLADTDLISSHSASSVALGSTWRKRLRIRARSKKGDKILPSNALPCFVGMGAVIASVPGMPRLATFSGKAAIEQGRRKPTGKDLAPLEGSGMTRIAAGENESGDSDEEEESDDDDDDETDEVDNRGISDQENDQGLKHEKIPSGSSLLRDEHEADLSALAEATKAAAEAKRVANTSHPSSSHPSPRKGERRRSTSKELVNPFNQLTTGFNDLRDKTVAAVNDVFGQKFGVDFAPGTNGKEVGPAPLWHRQHRRKTSSSKNQSAVDLPRRSSMADGFSTRVGASSANLPGRSSMSGSPFGSSATVGDEALALTPEAVLARYDFEARRRLLRSNYCRKQTQFLQTLQDVSARLLLLPKPARLSALRAELTELNHGLPSEVCFPLWCEAATQENQEQSDATSKRTPLPKGVKRGRHHRVVRINPSEAVVLNSADRVPFLLHVEVLVDDLDFDPERRSNRESLKKLVMQEDVRRRKTLISRQFSASGGNINKSGTGVPSGAVTGDTSLPVTPTAAEMADESKADVSHSLPLSRENALGADLIRRGTPPPLSRLTPHSSTPPVIDEEISGDGEEIDLTEQAYGSDLAAFGGDRGDPDSDEEDLAAVNIDHDHAAWSKSLPNRSQQVAPAAEIAPSKKREFSLDEYAERMRTAAIMLAQLNQSTNASAQPIVATNPHVSSTAQGGWSSWIMGTSWAATSNGSRSEAGQASAGLKAPVITVNNGAGVASVNGTTSNASIATSGQIGAGQGYGARGAGKKLVHTDTEMIRKRIMQEMMALEEERMERMKLVSSNRKIRRGANVEDEATVQKAVNKDDPSAAMFRESWASKKARIRAASPYGHLENWDVFSVIVKTGADLRQEQLAVQLIQEFARIWGETGSRCWVRYFRILVTSENSGIMETVTDSVSVHSIKKEAYSRRQQQNTLQQQQQEQMSAIDNAIQPAPAAPTNKIATYSLLDHFIDTFGDPSSAKFGKARQRFIESLAGYSIISYLLQIKDRHNGNILIDNEGHLIHIDFGFMLGISPGGVGFEAAPFKITQEYIDVIGGLDSAKFVEFKSLLCQGFRDVRKHAERIIMIVELMQKESKLPCFALGDLTSTYLRDRFQLALSQTQCDEFVDRLISGSINSTFTRLYDQYQYYSEGILS